MAFLDSPGSVTGPACSVLRVSATVADCFSDTHRVTIGPLRHDTSTTLAVFTVAPSAAVANGDTFLGVLLALINRGLAYAASALLHRSFGFHISVLQCVRSACSALVK